MFAVRLPRTEEILATMPMSEKEVTRLKRKVLTAEDKRIRGKHHPDSNSDDFVKWNFRQSWRNQPLPLGTVAGVDYDYFHSVLADCIRLFGQFGGAGDPDPFGRANWGSLVGDPAYSSLYMIWEKGVPVGQRIIGLKGPWVDFGPTADYAMFLEKWSKINGGSAIMHGVGVLHAIAARLQVKYIGAHHIFAHAQAPKGGSSVATQRAVRAAGARDGVTDAHHKAIEVFPVIRIMSRHWKARR